MGNNEKDSHITTTDNNQVINLGCRFNQYESSSIKQILDENESQNTIVINTCAVTAEAEKKCRQAVKKIAKENKDKRIIVTGCAAQINPDQFKAIKGVSLIVGNDKKLQSESYQENKQEEVVVKVGDVMSQKVVDNFIVKDFTEKSRAYIQIQNGCDHRCTFCIIPFGRGNSRSANYQDIEKQISLLLERGYNEIILTGVDLTSYQEPQENFKLGTLCKKLLHNLPKLMRLKLSSVDIAEIDEDLFDLIINEQKFAPYIHLSLQSGDNLILKRMKRRHTAEQVYEFCNKVLQKRLVCFGADIICGFPTETDEMFENSLKIVKNVPITLVHAFTFSPRVGTPAARMPQVERAIAKQRTRKLIDLGDENLIKFMENLIGTEQIITIENDHRGRTETFIKVAFERNENLIVGSLIKCRITKIIYKEESLLHGEIM